MALPRMENEHQEPYSSYRSSAAVDAVVADAAD